MKDGMKIKKSKGKKLKIVLAFVLAFIVIIAAVIIAFLWIGERLVTFTESVVTVGNNISVTFSSLMEGQEIAVFLTLGLVMCALSYLVYKLPISQMKSTSIS